MPADTFWDVLEHRIADGDLPRDGIRDTTPPPGVTAAALRRVLDLEAHHLGRSGSPVTLAQQVLGRAVALGEDALATAARDRITALGATALAGGWRTRPPSPALRRVLDGHGDAVTGLVLEPTGRLLSVDAAGLTSAWNPTTGRPVADPVRAGSGRAVVAPSGRAVAASTDGGLLAVTGPDHVVRVLSTNGSVVATLAGHTARVTALAFTSTPDGTTQVVSSSRDGTVRVWGVVAGSETAIGRGHSGPVRSLAVTGPDTVLTGGEDGTVRAWDSRTGATLGVMEGDTPVTGIAPVGARELLVVTADGAVHAFTLVQGVPQDPILLDDPGPSATGAVAAGPGHAVVTRADGTVELWRTGDAPRRTVLTGHCVPVRAAASDARGSVVATADDHGRILVWDIATAVPVVERPGLPTEVGSVAVAAGIAVSTTRGAGLLVARDLRTGDEAWRATGATDHVWSGVGGTRLFGAHGGRIEERHAAGGLRAGVCEVPGTVLAGRGTLVVVADGDRVTVADARTGRECRSVTVTRPVRRAALTPGGDTVLLGADTGLVAWRPADRTVLGVDLPRSQLTAVALDDEGCHAVAADADGHAHVWTVGETTVTTVRADPVQLRAVSGTTRHRVATAGVCGDVVLWDLATVSEVGRAPLDAPLTALAASPGRLVAGDGCGDTHCLEIVEGTAPVGTIPEQPWHPAEDGRSAIPRPRNAPVGLLQRLLRG